jgi:hypothetical protein
MLLKCLSVLITFGIASVIWADSPGRPDLNGNWRLDPSLSDLHSHMPAQLTWQIEQNDNSIHLVQRAQERKDPDDIRCATDGHDCRVKEEGHAATVSFYYNGPVLVELESEGQNRDTVTKKRMQVSSDGTTLTIEVIHIVPAGKPPEKLVLTRQPAVAAH